MISAPPLRWFSLLLFSALIHQTSSGLFSVKVQSPVSGLLGSSVSLPCVLENNLDARHLEVRWYRPKLHNTPALFYKDTQIQKNPVDVQYQGRVFLIGDLENGDVSMKLENLTLADRGDYVCYVKSNDWYDKATVSLRVRVVGSTPVLSLHEAGEGKINVSCHSHGWLPEPSVIWTDKDGRDLKHLSKDKLTSNTEGLVEVSSWMIVSPSESEWISCSVGLSGQERKESRTALFIPAESRNGYLLIPIVLLLCAAAAAAGITVYCVLRKKGVISKGKQRGTAEGTLSETEPLNQVCVEIPDENDSPPVIKAPHDVVVDFNHVKSSELQNPEAMKNKPQAADSGGEQRGCSSLPVFSTAGSATDKPNFISNPTPAACISETIQTSTPSNPTLTSISSNPTYTSTSSSPTLTSTSLNPTFTTTSSKHSSTPPLTTTPSNSTLTTTTSNSTPDALIPETIPTSIPSKPTPTTTSSTPPLTTTPSNSTLTTTTSNSTPDAPISETIPTFIPSKPTPTTTSSKPTITSSTPPLTTTPSNSTLTTTTSNSTPDAPILETIPTSIPLIPPHTNTFSDATPSTNPTSAASNSIQTSALVSATVSTTSARGKSRQVKSKPINENSTNGAERKTIRTEAKKKRKNYAEDTESSSEENENISKRIKVEIRESSPESKRLYEPQAAETKGESEMLVDVDSLSVTKDVEMKDSRPTEDDSMQWESS